jgi:flagellar hook-basal body complex protein FliE
MAVPFSTATFAYGNAAQLLEQASRGAQPAPQINTGPEFGELLSESINSIVETGNRSDQMAVQAVNGESNMVDVVTAIAETEVAIEGLVAVRDRVISAYEEIMRMPI